MEPQTMLEPLRQQQSAPTRSWAAYLLWCVIGRALHPLHAGTVPLPTSGQFWSLSKTCKTHHEPVEMAERTATPQAVIHQTLASEV